MTDDLRKLAEAATGGPWVPALEDHADPDSGLTLVRAAHATKGMAIATTFAQRRHGRLARNEANAAFIAAANPTAILALLDERDALRAKVERLEGALRDIEDHAPATMEFCTASIMADIARAALSEAPAREERHG